jgi:tetratricopeptide (TPR) repeat protein
MSSRERGEELSTRAGLALARREYAQAAELAARAQEADPNNDDAPLFEAVARRETGDLAGAAAAARRAIELRPFHPTAMQLLGVISLEQGRRDAGRTWLARAALRAPALPEAARHRRGPAAREETPRWCVWIVASGDDAALERTRAGVAALDPEILPVSDAAWPDAYARTRADVVLVLHAGEVPDAAALEALARFAPASSCVGLYVNLKDGVSCSRPALRAFRNAPGLRFAPTSSPDPGASLEKLAERWGLEVGFADGAIRSTRALFPLAGDPANLDAAIDAAPSDPRLRLARAEALLATRDPARALVDARRGLADAASGDPAPHPTVASGLAAAELSALSRLERWEELARIAAVRRLAAPDDPNAIYFEGLAALRLGDPALASRRLTEAGDAVARTPRHPVVSELAGAGRAMLLGAAALERRALDAARDAFAEAIRLAPRSHEARLGALTVELLSGRFEAFLAGVDAFGADFAEVVEAWLAAERLLASLPALAPATAAWMDEARRRFPERDDVRLRHGDALARAARAQEALEAWGATEPEGSHGVALRIAAHLAGGRELRAAWYPRRDEIVAALVRHLQTWLDLGAWEAIDAALTRLPSAERVLPGVCAAAASWLDGAGQPDAASRLRA